MDKLFSSVNRDEAHRALEYVRGEAAALGRLNDKGIDLDYPGIEKLSTLGPLIGACCQEDPNDPKPFQVWSGPPLPYIKPPEESIQGINDLDDLADRVAQRILAKLDKGAR